MLTFVSLSFVWDGASDGSWSIHLNGLVARSTHIIVYIAIFIPTHDLHRRSVAMGTGGAIHHYSN